MIITIIPFVSLSCLMMTMDIAHGFVQQEFGIVNHLRASSTLIRSRSASSSSHYQILSPLNLSSSLRGSSDDHQHQHSSSVEPSGMDDNSANGETMVTVEDVTNNMNTEEEAPQSLNGAEVSYLVDDITITPSESDALDGSDDNIVEVNLLEENIGEDDMEQALAAGVVATLGTGNMISEDVYLNEETGEIYEISDKKLGSEETMEEEESPPESDHGGVVSGLFGNLRIPASLLAGASLGQAFALPFADADGLTLGLVKRVYVLCMLGSFSSMLLTVLVSTTVMTDITLSNPRLAKSPGDYINRYYALDYMLTKINFFVGSAVFAIGSMLRGWAFLNLAVVGRGVLGIMGSFTLMSAAIVLEYNRRQAGKSILGQAKDTFQLMKNKTRTNKLFGIGAIIWGCTIVYLLAKVPHIANHLIYTAEHVHPWWRKVALLSGGYEALEL